MRHPLCLVLGLVCICSVLGNPTPAPPDKPIPVSEPIFTGALRNPFLAQLPLKTPANKTHLIAYFETAGTTQGDNPWHVLRYSYTNHPNPPPFGSHWFERALVAFRFGPHGHPAEVIQVPGHAKLRYSRFPQLAPKHNARWLVFPVSQPKETDDAIEPDHWSVIDLGKKPPQHRLISSTGTSSGLLHFRLIGDNLIYICIHNPTGDPSQGAQSLQTTGDPVYWVVQLNLLTGKTTRLASSRDHASQSPLQAEDLGMFKRVFSTGPTSFTVVGSKNRSRSSYEIQSAQWQPIDDAGIKQSSADEWNESYPGWTSINVDGFDWNLHLGLRDKKFLRAGGSKTTVDIPLRMDYGDFARSYADYKKIVQRVEKEKADFKLFMFTPHGVAVAAHGGFYFWIPMDQIKQRIRATYAAQETQSFK